MTGFPSDQFAFALISKLWVFPSGDCVQVAMRGIGSPVLGSWLTRFSKRTPATTPEGESLTRIGFMVLMSADDPSITRPPATGFSPAEGDGDEPAGGACVQAVATSTADARAATNVRIVPRLFMCPPLAPFGYPRTVAECIQRHRLPLHLVYTGELRRPFTFRCTFAGRRRRARRCSGKSHGASPGPPSARRAWTRTGKAAGCSVVRGRTVTQPGSGTPPSDAGRA